MTVAEWQALLKSPNPPSGAFLLCGEEGYLVRTYLSQLRGRLFRGGGDDAFNHPVYDGADVDFAAIAGDLDTPPFFSDAKLVEWHNANLSKLTDAEEEQMAAVCRAANAHPDTTLVFVCQPDGFDPGTARRPSPAYRKLSGMLSIVNFEKSGDAQLSNWLKRHFAHEGVAVTPDALRQMIAQCGHSMEVLANETEKLAAYAHANSLDTVTADTVREAACSNTESDTFALTNALGAGDAPAAFAALADLRARRVDPMLILGQIFRFETDLLSVALLAQEGISPAGIASRLSMAEYKAGMYVRYAKRCPPDRWRRAVAACAEADRLCKSSYGTDTASLIDRLVAGLVS